MTNKRTGAFIQLLPSILMIAKKSIPIRQLTKVCDPSSEFRMLSLSELLKKEELKQQIHRHDFYFMLIVIKGTGKHTIDFTIFKIEPSMVFFMRPGQIHELDLDAGTTGFILEFSGDFVPKVSENSRYMFNSISQHNALTFNIKSLQPVLQSAEKIYSESQIDFIEKNEVIRLHLHLIFIELYRQVAIQQLVQEQDSDAFTKEKLYTFLELLEKNIHRKKRVSEYAEMMNLTPYQLNNITKSVLNKSVSILIKDQVLLEAKRLLLTTSNQVNQIAIELGFEDVSYFIRFFKKHLGSSPAVFRQNFK